MSSIITNNLNLVDSKKKTKEVTLSTHEQEVNKYKHIELYYLKLFFF